MKYILKNIGKGNYGNSGIKLSTNNLFRLDDNKSEIPTSKINNWDQAYSWGNHNGQYVLISNYKTPQISTGNIINLSNHTGITYNYSTPLSDDTYYFMNPSINGFARVFINAPVEPVVINAIKVEGSDFVPNYKMEMIVDSPDGISVEYYFVLK